MQDYFLVVSPSISQLCFIMTVDKRLQFTTFQIAVWVLEIPAYATSHAPPASDISQVKDLFPQVSIQHQDMIAILIFIVGLGEYVFISV